jgi:hypothetical protein
MSNFDPGSEGSAVSSRAELAMLRAEALEPIPRITDPLGRSWEQPDRSEIMLDDTHAVMTRRSFNKLHEYSGSFPTGVYEGKMWKRHDGGFDVAFRSRGGKPIWKLVWYGRHANPLLVSNNFREILIVEDGAPILGCSCCLPCSPISPVPETAAPAPAADPSDLPVEKGPENTASE